MLAPRASRSLLLPFAFPTSSDTKESLSFVANSSDDYCSVQEYQLDKDAWHKPDNNKQALDRSVYVLAPPDDEESCDYNHCQGDCGECYYHEGFARVLRCAGAVMLEL